MGHHKNTILKESSLKQCFIGQQLVKDNFMRVVKMLLKEREGRKPRRESSKPWERRESPPLPTLPHPCPDQSPETKNLIFGSNLFETYPAFSPVGIGVPLTIWVRFSQEGIRLKREI